MGKFNFLACTQYSVHTPEGCADPAIFPSCERCRNNGSIVDPTLSKRWGMINCHKGKRATAVNSIFLVA